MKSIRHLNIVNFVVLVTLLGCSESSNFVGANKSVSKEPSQRPGKGSDGKFGADEKTNTEKINERLNEGNLSYNSGLNIISEPSKEHGASGGMSSQQYNLSSFKLETYDKTYGPVYGQSQAPEWDLSEDGLTVVQKWNADASIFYGDTFYKDYTIEGQWKTAGADDDLMGFVFGMQNSDEFYLFQWKANDQPSGGCKLESGMQVRKMSLNGSHSMCDFWNSYNTEKAEVLSSNKIPWERNKTYKFKLVFHPGNSSIEISDVETNEVLSTLTVKDDSYKSGKFGFYNYSQQSVTYSGFSIAEIPPEIYTYQVETDADESVAVSYNLAESPEGMTIDKNSGLVSWKADNVAPGKYKVRVVAEGNNGSSAEQGYEIDLKK